MSAKLEEGSVFAGRYRVIHCLAEGGMGAVYEVIHLETDRRRALKVMHPHLFQSEEMRERFKREARIAAHVDSEYIVDVSDAGVDYATRMPFLVMELLRGEELGDRLKRVGRLPPEEVVTYMQQVAWALDRTHAAAIVHRDLKPANLFLTTREDGTPRIKILDFGVAKLVAESATAGGATQSLGTPIYMAPEQFRTNTKLTAAADIYALTLMTYTLLVGEAYWKEEARNAGDVIAFAMTVVNGAQEPAGLRAARRGVRLPPGFDAWFARGTAVNPADRFPSATEAVRALRAVGAPAGPGVAPMVPMFPHPPMGSDPGIYPLTGSRPALISYPMMERVMTSTGASGMTTAPVERSRAPFIAGAAVLALSLAGLGAWMALRPTTSSRMDSAAPGESLAATAATSAAPAARSAAPAATSAAPVETAPAAIPASAAPSADAPEAKTSSKPVAAASTPQAAPLGKSAPQAAAPEKKKSLSGTKLLGRD